MVPGSGPLDPTGFRAGLILIPTGIDEEKIQKEEKGLAPF